MKQTDNNIKQLKAWESAKKNHFNQISYITLVPPFGCTCVEEVHPDLGSVPAKCFANNDGKYYCYVTNDEICTAKEESTVIEGALYVVCKGINLFFSKCYLIDDTNPCERFLSVYNIVQKQSLSINR